MKNALWTLVLTGLIGALAWEMGYFEKKKDSAQSQETTENEIKEAGKPKTDTDEKEKLEAEAKAQKEKAEKIADEEAKAQAGKKLSELQKQYDEKKAAFITLKEEKAKLKNALEDLEKKAPEFVTASEEHQNKAQDISSQIRSIEEKITKQALTVQKAQKKFSQSDCVVLGSRDKKDRTGWYYVSSPGDIRPMSELAHRNKGKTIKYVYKDDNRKNNNIEQTKDELERQREIMKELKQQLSILKSEYEKQKVSYQEFIKSRIESISAEMNDAKETGKKLDAELKTLKSADGKIS